MFSPFAGLEDVRVRVEIEWQNAPRWVVARLEQLPGASPDAGVVVCEFEDAPGDGQWLLVKGHHLQPVFETLSIPDRVRQNVPLAFANRGDFHAARVFRFEELSPPLLALAVMQGKDWWPNGFWRLGFEPFSWQDSAKNHAPFIVEEPFATLPATQAREKLLRAYHDPNSDARFAFDWLQLSHDEQMARLSGYCGAWSDLRRLTRLMLGCIIEIGPRGNSGSEPYIWSLQPGAPTRGRLIKASNRHAPPPNARFTALQDRLFSHFVPNFRRDLWKRHLFAREIWRDAEEFEAVQIGAPPSMHEQLEARLELRDWLQGKAAPDEIRQLLG